MEHLAYICEGNLFVYNTNIQYLSEVMGSFNYEGNPINIIFIKGKTIEEVRKISEDDSIGVESIKNRLSPEVFYAVKKTAHMSKKEPIQPPFKIEFDGEEANFLFEEGLLKVPLLDSGEEIYFYFPAPEGFSEKVED